MKPITAITLSMEKTYSASPYPLTPNMLMAKMKMRKRVTKMLLAMESFQY